MRKIYLFIAITFLVASACKKEIKEPIVSQSVDAPGTCSGNTWSQDQDYTGMRLAPCFEYNNKVYFINRWPEPNSYTYQKTVTIYDGTSWEVKPSNVPGYVISDVCNFWFVIGNKGYISSPNGVYMVAYDFATNTWSQKANFPGPVRYHPAFFSIGNKGYVIGGRVSDTKHYNDTWEYNPATNAWTQKTSFPNFGKERATGFTIGNKGYIVNGWISHEQTTPPYNFYLNDLMEYDPSDDSWQVKAAFPGQARTTTSAFVIGSYAYVGGGFNNGPLQDFYRYNPATNNWLEIAPVMGPVQVRRTFAINSKGYAVLENDFNPVNMQKYTPKTCTSISSGISNVIVN